MRHTSKAARQAIKGAVMVTRNGVKAGYIVSHHAVVASSRATLAVARRSARVAGRVTRAGISKTRRMVVGAVVKSKTFVTHVALPAAARAVRDTAALALRVTTSSAYAVARCLFSAGPWLMLIVGGRERVETNECACVTPGGTLPARTLALQCGAPSSVPWC